MISISSKLAFSLLIIGFCAICKLTEAQKTAANSFQQQQQISQSGSNPNSVYGGYQARQQGSQLVSPVNRPRRPSQQAQPSYSRTEQQQTEIARQPRPIYQQQQEESQYSSSASNSYDQQAEANAEPPSYGSVAGAPGTDFPNYARVPKTSFTCEGKPYEYGMYADEETQCQAYHLCYNGRKDSFLCGPGTVFNQRILHCDYWYSTDCAKSSQYWGSNAYMGSSQPEPGPVQAGEQPQSSYQRTQGSSYSSQSSNIRPVGASSSSYKSRVPQPQPQQQQVQEDGY